MRSQNKPLPKKNVTLKQKSKHSPTKQVKKKKIVSSKKPKSGTQTSAKLKKKKIVEGRKFDKANNESFSESNDDAIPGTSKSHTSQSPTCNTLKDKKVSAKSQKKEKKKKLSTPRALSGESTTSENEIKYMINKSHVKVKKAKNSRYRIKSSPILSKTSHQERENTENDVNATKSEHTEQKSEKENNESSNKTNQLDDGSAIKQTEVESEVLDRSDKIRKSENTLVNLLSSPPRPAKPESERTPKFFTSQRPPRTIDIDVKTCKTTKTSLNVSDSFLSVKCSGQKLDEPSHSKNIVSSLVSHDSEVDVYTFTDYKVDSPKNILTDLRSPLTKNVGRVRPIARVKGTIIDKNKIETDKKKYSPHRPIEEVVQQLKAGKKAQEARLVNKQLGATSNAEDESCKIINQSTETTEANYFIEDSPKSFVSKSYKMVARKTNPGLNVTQEFQAPSTSVESKTDVESSKNSNEVKKSPKKTNAKPQISHDSESSTDDEMEKSTFSLSKDTKMLGYLSSNESTSESSDETKTRDSDSDISKTKKNVKGKRKPVKNRERKRKIGSKELKNLSADSLSDPQESSVLYGEEKPSKRRLKLLSMWTGPKKHRMASLNALAKVHCLYENESRTHMELGLMKTIERPPVVVGKVESKTKKKQSKQLKSECVSEKECDKNEKVRQDSSEEDDSPAPTRTLRVMPGSRGPGKYWDPKSSTSSSEDSEAEYTNKSLSREKKKLPAKPSTSKSDSEKTPTKVNKTVSAPKKKKRARNEVTMDLKDMVVQKRMASLNATAILAASYEKRSPKSGKDDTTTSDSCSDESVQRKSKNGVAPGVKSENIKKEDVKKENEDVPGKQKVEVIVNQDTDVTITGVYSTHHHEGFCTVSGMQYRISATSHTQTTATAAAEQEGCSREDSSRYTPLSALSSMKPPADQLPHPGVQEIGGLNRRPGCSSAFSAPSTTHHDPGYYQPAGPLIKEGGAGEDRALARYHPHYHHPPHPQMVGPYGSPYYGELCYGRYYRPPAPGPPPALGPPYHLPPPQPDPTQMVGVGGEYPPQYYAPPPCYQHPPPRLPYMEYRPCPCPMSTCPKNVIVGPATGRAPTGGGPARAPPGACRGPPRLPRPRPEPSLPTPSQEVEPPAGAAAPHLLGGGLPKRELYVEGRHDTAGPADHGPPSPARGSAGLCAQPPPIAPRRARLGKAMARRSLTGDDTTLLLTPQPRPPSADDDVVAISSPEMVPIDLSSPDTESERRAPLLDVKKENEGAPLTPTRKPEALALREQNSSEPQVSQDTPKIVDTPNPKRRYSRTKLDIDMKDVSLEDCLPTNGIGEHVKLQKRRKITPEATNTVFKVDQTEIKKKCLTPKCKQKHKTLLTPEKRGVKRKSSTCREVQPSKIQSVEDTEDGESQSTVKVTKPKNTSALLLDKLIRKNSLDCGDRLASVDTEPNPATLFLPLPQNGVKKLLNINNNVVTETANPKNSLEGTVSKLKASKIQKSKEKLGTNSNNELSMQKKEGFERNVIKAALEKKITSRLSESNNDPIPVPCLSPSEELLSRITERAKTGVTTNKTIAEKILEKINAAKAASKLTLSGNIKSQKSNKTTDIPTNISKTEKSKLIQTENEIVKNVSTNDKISLNQKPKLLSEKNENKPKFLAEKSEKRKLIPEKEELKRKLFAEKVEDNGKPKLNEKIDCEKPKGEKAKLLVHRKLSTIMVEPTDLVEEICVLPPDSSIDGSETILDSDVLIGPVSKKAKRRRSGQRKGRRMNLLLDVPAAAKGTPKWSNGWTWEGEPYLAKVYLNNDTRCDVVARCYRGMRHAGGDRIARGDCVLLRATTRHTPPFVARLATLWENPTDGEMMVSLVWYYRPEHTEGGRRPEDAHDEVFASRHRDANSVACIEDKCYVLTYNEYCRYRKRLKAAEEGIVIPQSIVPAMRPSEVSAAVATNDSKLPPGISPELVLFCRKVYDFRSKKIQAPNK